MPRPPRRSSNVRIIPTGRGGANRPDGVSSELPWRTSQKPLGAKFREWCLVEVGGVGQIPRYRRGHLLSGSVQLIDELSRMDNPERPKTGRQIQQVRPVLR